MTAALLLKNVSKARGKGPQATQALVEVSLRVEPGEVLALQGPSGAGKTTLLSVAGGLLEADAGEVVLAGRKLGGDRTADRAHRARSVGFVFQRPNLIARLTVRENVLLAAAVAGLSTSEAEREATALLEALGLDGLAHRLPEQLSGGQEQRCAVARALIHRPAVVLADEPTGSLDSKSGARVAEQLLAIAKERGAAVVIATHDAGLAARCEHCVRIIDGRLEEVEARRPEQAPATGTTA
ncbi:MAG: ABC transporter ATP-binding protein [Myxococcales bacterium]